MKLFTVGPVEMYPETLEMEGTQLPYFRDEEFSETMKNCERLFLKTVNAPDNAYFIALTCSGTGGMDAVVQNVLRCDDKVLVINGGSFGQRFADICKRYEIPYDTYDIPFGKAFSEKEFEGYAGKGYTALLVNLCETGTGQKYDPEYLGKFCAENGMLFIVDAVSAYLADHIDMKAHGIDVIITASQKALALAPGAALLALSERARQRVYENKASYYFDLNAYIEDQKRGQPPFTSAVGIMLTLCRRLEDIISVGMKETLKLHEERALFFREGLRGLPVSIPGYPLSNCCTPVIFPEENAEEIYRSLRDKYGLVLTPSGGELKKKMLRAGHIGNLTLDDHVRLLECLKKEL